MVQQAVILTAGRGVRMGDLTNDTPKPMFLINGRPILEYTLSNLPDEISEAVLIIGYKGEVIKSHFGDQYKNKKIRYVTQENLNGSGDALHKAKDLLKDKFLVLNGDDLYHYSDLEKLIASEPPALLAKEMDNSGRFGVLRIDDKGYLSEIIEAPQENYGNLVNIGAYLLDRNFFDYELAKKSEKVDEKEFGLPQTMAKMAEDYKIKVVKAEFWQPIGYPEDILEAEKVIDKFL